MRASRDLSPDQEDLEKLIASSTFVQEMLGGIDSSVAHNHHDTTNMAQSTHGDHQDLLRFQKRHILEDELEENRKCKPKDRPGLVNSRNNTIGGGIHNQMNPIPQSTRQIVQNRHFAVSRNYEIVPKEGPGPRRLADTSINFLCDINSTISKRKNNNINIHGIKYHGEQFIATGFKESYSPSFIRSHTCSACKMNFIKSYILSSFIRCPHCEQVQSNSYSKEENNKTKTKKKKKNIYGPEEQCCVYRNFVLSKSGNDRNGVNDKEIIIRNMRESLPHLEKYFREDPSRMCSTCNNFFQYQTRSTSGRKNDII